MVVGRGDDLVEGRGAMAVALDIEHGREIVRRHRVVGIVFGDLNHGASSAGRAKGRVNMARFHE